MMEMRIQTAISRLQATVLALFFCACFASGWQTALAEERTPAGVPEGPDEMLASSLPEVFTSMAEDPCEEAPEKIGEIVSVKNLVECLDAETMAVRDAAEEELRQRLLALLAEQSYPILFGISDLVQEYLEAARPYLKSGNLEVRWRLSRIASGAAIIDSLQEYALLEAKVLFAPAVRELGKRFLDANAIAGLVLLTDGRKLVDSLTGKAGSDPLSERMCAPFKFKPVKPGTQIEGGKVVYIPNGLQFTLRKRVSSEGYALDFHGNLRMDIDTLIGWDGAVIGALTGYLRPAALGAKEDVSVLMTEFVDRENSIERPPAATYEVDVYGAKKRISIWGLQPESDSLELMLLLPGGAKAPRRSESDEWRIRLDDFPVSARLEFFLLYRLLEKFALSQNGSQPLEIPLLESR